jgi:hypothetical protein
VFLGVPRVWEKIHEKLQEVAKTVTGVKKKLSTWAKVRFRHFVLTPWRLTPCTARDATRPVVCVMLSRFSHA